MEIEYYRESSFSVATKKVQVVVNPLMGNGKDLASKGVVSLATEARYLVENPIASLSFEGPGEYEIGDVSIVGVAAEDKPLVGEVPPTHYRIEVGEIRIAVIASSAKKLTEGQLERIGVVDIVVVPVEPGVEIAAAAIVKQIDPRVVLPLGGAQQIAHELGKVPEDMDKLKLKNASGIPASLSVIALKAKYS